MTSPKYRLAYRLVPTRAVERRLVTIQADVDVDVDGVDADRLSKFSLTGFFRLIVLEIEKKKKNK